MNVMIDDFTGDPQELYNFVVEEINRWELPDITYTWDEAGETVTMLGRFEGAVPVLGVSFRGSRYRVLGYQFSRIFIVSVWQWHEPQPNSRDGLLRKIALNTFPTVLEKSVQRALRRHLEARSAPVPEGLDPKSVFFTPGSSAAA